MKRYEVNWNGKFWDVFETPEGNMAAWSDVEREITSLRQRVAELEGVTAYSAGHHHQKAHQVQQPRRRRRPINLAMRDQQTLRAPAR